MSSGIRYGHKKIVLFFVLGGVKFVYSFCCLFERLWEAV